MIIENPFDKKYFHFKQQGSPPPFHPRGKPVGPFPHLPPRGPFDHLGGPLPFTLEDFKDIKLYIVFILLEHNPEGITGYEIQEKYKFPRGSLIRLLEHLESNGHVITKESVEKGRNKKLYIITDKGRDFFDKLKQRWAHQFAMMSEFAPPERFGNPFVQPYMTQILDKYEDKEDFLDYFRGMRSRLKGRLIHLKTRMEDIDKIKVELDDLIEKIEKMEKPNVDEIKQLIGRIQEKFQNRNPII